MESWISVQRIVILSVLAAVTVACVEETKETDEPPDPPPPLTGEFLSEERLGAIAAYLSSDDMAGREPGTPEHAAARAYIIEQLQACSVQPAGPNGFEQPVTTGIGINILGGIAGTDPNLSQRHVLIGAHYDHVGVSDGQIYNGAGDNAAAVAILIGLACELARNPVERSIIIAAWDTEEPPTFLTDQMGSEFFAANPTVPLETIDATLILELVGLNLWPGSQMHLVFGEEHSPEIAASLDAATPPEGLIVRRGGYHLVEISPLGLQQQRWSDYAAFIDRGRPALMLVDGPNKQYHTPQDTYDKLDVPKMSREANYHLDIAHRIAANPAVPAFDPAGANHLLDSSTMVDLDDFALAPGGLIDSLGLTAASRSDVESDRAAVAAVKASLEGGGTASVAQINDLRSAAQRILCLASTMYSEDMCGYL